MPVPARGTLCGLPVALSVTEILAVRMPAPVGVKVVLIVQDVPTAIDAAHVLLCRKSPAFAPVIPMLLIVSAAVPLLVSVTTLAGLDVPTV